MSKVILKGLKYEKGELRNPENKNEPVVGYLVYSMENGNKLGTVWLKNRVKVRPKIEKGRMNAFENYIGLNQRIGIGTKLLYLTGSSVTDQILPNLVTIVEDYDHHFTIDTGRYKMSVNKSSVYCKTEGLYLFEPAK